MEGSIVEGYWLLRGVICKNLILPPMISVLVLFSFLFSLSRVFNFTYGKSRMRALRRHCIAGL